MNRAEATEIAKQELAKLGRSARHELVLLEDRTREKPYGWVFIYNTRAYVETGNIFEALGGNGPIVVEAANGRVTHLGTANSLEQELAAFEKADKLT